MAEAAQVATLTHLRRRVFLNCQSFIQSQQKQRPRITNFISVVRNLDFTIKSTIFLMLAANPKLKKKILRAKQIHLQAEHSQGHQFSISEAGPLPGHWLNP